jgi:HTH-type transcriptional regulator/antitoxin HipB
VGPDLPQGAERSSLGATLRQRRRALRLSQQDLADLAEVGVRLVHEVEHDTDRVQLRNLLRLLHALGLHLQVAPGAADRVVTHRLDEPGRP